jgi:DNA repair exonuclease SbcCD ATPase subunit
MEETHETDFRRALRIGAVIARAVDDPGAAQRDDGFHSYLARYLGWELPQVPRFDGSETTLYLEAIFPMMFVEQKRGWSTIQGPFPTYLRIQDIARRVMEFLLDLEAGRIRRERAELRRAIGALQQRWADQLSVLNELAGRSIRVRGIPQSPTAEFVHTQDVRIEVLQEDEWQPLESIVDRYTARMKELEAADIPSAEAEAPENERRLAAAREKADETMASLEANRAEFSTQLEEHRAIERRITFLEADLKRNQDALRLRNFGSELGKASGEQICPTCHQSVSSELLPTMERAGMGLEKNISFVRSQLDLYRATLASSSEQLSDYRARYRAADEEVKERQQEIRGLRQSLVQASEAPARSVIEEIVRRQAFLDKLSSLRQTVEIL